MSNKHFLISNSVFMCMDCVHTCSYVSMCMCMCVEVKGQHCMPSSVTSPHFLRQGLSSIGWADWPVSSADPPISTSQYWVTNTYHSAEFSHGLGIQTQILIHGQQGLYLRSYLPQASRVTSKGMSLNRVFNYEVWGR